LNGVSRTPIVCSQFDRKPFGANTMRHAIVRTRKLVQNGTITSARRTPFHRRLTRTARK